MSPKSAAFEKSFVGLLPVIYIAARGMQQNYQSCISSFTQPEVFV